MIEYAIDMMFYHMMLASLLIIFQLGNLEDIMLYLLRHRSVPALLDAGGADSGVFQGVPHSAHQFRAL